MTPNKLILTAGLRLDQMYTRENAKDDARKGMVMKWDKTWVCQSASHAEHKLTRRKEETRKRSQTKSARRLENEFSSRRREYLILERGQLRAAGFHTETDTKKRCNARSRLS